MHRRSFLTGSLTTVLLAGSRIAHAQPSAGLVLSGGTVITMDPVLGDLPRGDVHVRDGAVVAVAPAIEVPGAERIDATGTIVMPGFVDTHWHMWNTLARGLPQSRLGPFAKTMGALAAVWTPQASALGVRLALAEAVNSGITTANNWAHNIKSLEFAEAELTAQQAAGVRGRFSYGYPQVLKPDQLMDVAGLETLKRVISPAAIPA
jgi:5-methylthioadenosine/S-adenosylhomocysteine deaminase